MSCVLIYLLCQLETRIYYDVLRWLWVVLVLDIAFRMAVGTHFHTTEGCVVVCVCV